MKRFLMAAAIVAAASTTAVAGTRIIPVAGHTPGANGTTWTTDVSLTNDSASAASVELVFRSDDGAAHSRFVTVEAHQSVLLDDAVAPEKFGGGNPPSWLGQLELRSGADIAASAHIFTRGAAGGTFGSSYDGVDPAVLSNAGTIAGLLTNARYRTNVAFANADDRTNGFDFVLRREDGSVAETRHLDVPPHTTRQLGVGDSAADANDDRRLSLEWTSTGGAYVVGSVIDNKSGDPTSAPSSSRDVTTLFFPVVGRTAGSNGTFWSTSAAIASSSASAGSVTFVYVDNATGQTYTKTSDVAAHGTVRTDDLNAFVGAPAGTGSLKVSSTVAVVSAVRVFNTQEDGSTFGSAVLPQSSVVGGSRVRVHGVRRDDDFRLNVSISNDDTADANGTVHLFDDRGAEVEAEPFHIEHGKSGQVAMARGAAQVHAGELEVETENGVTVTVIASNVDNHTGDTIQHEAEQENERQSELEISISPRAANVGAPVTFTIEHAGTNVVSVAWSFGDGTTASGLTVTHAYVSAGEFKVDATITLSGGAVVRDREDVRVGGTAQQPGPTSIDFTYAPSAPAAGQEVVFTASGASSGGTFTWQFPGGVRKSGNVVTFTFAAAGTYEVEVELEREGSATLRATHFVTVGGGSNGGGQTATSVDFTTSPAAPRAGQAVTFTASFDRQPPAGSVVKWRFPNDSRPEGPSATYTFATAGTYTVRVQLEQPGQASIEREKSVTVSP